jgi:hypothetical protein
MGDARGRPVAGRIAVMTWLPRVFGVLTAVYGLATLVRPAIFAKPAGLSGDEPPVPVGVLVRAVGVRDVANGLAMATAPAGPALRAAIGARIAADFGDALTFALSPNEDPNARRKAVAVGVGWGALNLLGLLTARRG